VVRVGYARSVRLRSRRAGARGHVGLRRRPCCRMRQTRRSMRS
jgi:hypothetical protein